ncbi:hypothetical protein NA57DRAFT_27407, partial [Rhizodiscina lignyota]
HSVTINVDIPKYLNPDDVIAALHGHTVLMDLQPLVTGYRPIPAEDLSGAFMGREEEEHFEHASAAELTHYHVDETITIVPGIGEWGKTHITFPARWQNTPSGAKGWADAPQGVTVASIWTVKPKEGKRGSWELEEQATVSCSGWLMPLVKRSFEGAQRDICQGLIEKL